MPSDSAITIKAPQFERQEALVEYLARRSLPTGLKLYVKPHPYAIDWYSLPMLNHLRSLPNVRLIAPTINVHEMISNCEGVVVITSTAGFESLFHLKPVVVLGRVFYRGYGVTRDVDNLLALPAAISEALRAPPDREAVLRLVHACYAASLPGELTNPHPENLALIARSLLEKAKRLAGHRRNADTC
jgi:capsule polysaccharide export protein KpsC/LpsZ